MTSCRVSTPEGEVLTRHPSRTGRPGRLAVSGVLLAAAGCDPKDGDPVSAAPRKASAPAPVTADSSYVALGDSYTAGPGVPDRTGTPAGCDRSDRNYPSLVARELGIGSADFRDMSCSGATIADLSAAQSTDDGDNPAQLSALSGTTRLVTLGIGVVHERRLGPVRGPARSRERGARLVLGGWRLSWVSTPSRSSLGSSMSRAA